MINKDFGIILDIEPSNFIADGAFYINKNITDDENSSISNIELLSNIFSSYNFDSKVSEIINEVSNNEKDKTITERAEEINTFFEDNKGKVLDLIIFSDTGVRGTNKIIMEENSILYIKIAENLKLGFFINKTLAQFLNIGD
jgi:hypothetical protein